MTTSPDFHTLQFGDGVSSITDPNNYFSSSAARSQWVALWVLWILWSLIWLGRKIHPLTAEMEGTTEGEGATSTFQRKPKEGFVSQVSSPFLPSFISFTRKYDVRVTA